MKKETLISLLPPEKGQEKVISKRQNVNDIEGEVLEAHRVFAPDYDKICCEFAGGSVEKKLFDFCRKNLRYDVETEADQTTKSPTVLLKQGHCDCKGYAGFICGILDGLNRAGKGKFNCCYRFAEYDDGTEVHYHVYCVVRHPDGREVWVDPVLSIYNTRDPLPDSWIDKELPPMLTRLSGVQPGAMRPAARSAAPARIACCAGPLSAYGAPLVPGFTQDQMGIPVLQAVFQHWGSEYPQAPSTLAVNPPVRFFDGNTQIALPPPVTAGGQAVPPLPANINLVWDSSFMGMPIPPDMLNVANNNGSLIVWPLQIGSVGGTSAATNNFLWNTNRYCLFLMLGALENLIYSYSSWPWGNGFNDLAQQLNSARNYANWLVYPGANKRTWFGNVLQQTAKVQEVALPIESVIANVFVPGSGVALEAAGSALNAAVLNSKGPSGPANTFVDTPEITADGSVSSSGLLSELFPGSTTLPSITNMVSSFAQSNPLVTMGIAAAAGLLLYELFNDK
jgi:hypothetical protein